MRALRLRYVAIGLLTYVQSIGIVVSALASSASTSSSSSSRSSPADNSRTSSVSTAAAATVCRAGQQVLGEFNDVASRTVQSPIVFAGRAKKYRLVAAVDGADGDTLTRYRVPFSVVETFKGQTALAAMSIQPSNGSSELIVYVDVVVSSPRRAYR
jgi:hypothetical protein